MKRKLTWLGGWLCATLALGLIFWLQVDGKRKAGVAAEGIGPRVTKPYPRGHETWGTREKNLREEFDAARKRGLTEEEVRRVIEEYSEAIAFEDESHRPVEEVLSELSNCRFEFYLSALAEGLNLTQEQIESFQSKLPSLVQQNIQQSLLMISVFKNKNVDEAGEHPSDQLTATTRLEQIEAITNYPLFTHNYDFTPWKLFELSDSQKQLIGYQDEAEEWIWLNGHRTLDHGTAEYYGDLEDPFSDSSSVMSKAGQIFPLSMWQVERLGDFEDEAVSPHTPRIKNGGELDHVKFLTRPQLKTLLLFNPEMAVRVIEELGK